MKVACPSCQSSLTIDDKKIPAGGARIKCPTCQNIFPVKPGMDAGVPLPGAAAPTSTPSGAVPLPGISAAKPAQTNWDQEPTRVAPPGAVPLPGAASNWETAPTAAHPAMGAVPLPGGAGIPGATQHAPLPSNVPRPSSRSGISTVPLPGISAARPAPAAWEEESTRVAGAPVPGGIDLDLSAQATAAVPALGARPSGASVPLPGGSAPARGSAGAVPLPGPSPSGFTSNAGAVPLPGSSPSGFTSNAGAVPLPGSSPSGFRSNGGAVPQPGSSPSGLRPSAAAVPLPGGFSGGDELEADFGGSPTGHIPLPGAAATQAMPALQTDDVPFSDDFGEEAPAPPAQVGGAVDFGFPDLPGDGAPGFDPPQSQGASGGFGFDAAPAPAPVSGGFDFDAPPSPAPVSGGFDFGAPPAPAP
ncbi:MAG: zinc-ribbon domain-containing protein, partial [Myxococcus sp.]|nr:zinc-ribbon domain-containing protein [Myxococcus sp.]